MLVFCVGRLRDTKSWSGAQRFDFNVLRTLLSDCAPVEMPTVDAPPGRTVSTRLELTRLILVKLLVDTDSTLTELVRACHPAQSCAA